MSDLEEEYPKSVITKIQKINNRLDGQNKGWLLIIVSTVLGCNFFEIIQILFTFILSTTSILACFGLKKIV